ncbi:MAG: hypothetical protein GX361_03275 [Bacteroidales bacterium]|nr:hypothetical protein [Bacteroidales bacterium]
MIKRFCHADSGNCSDLKNWGLLLLRLAIGFFMLTHSWAKLSNYTDLQPILFTR